MKFYKIKKDVLVWKEMQQLQYKWDLPILVDTDKNVILGNSLKDCLPDWVIVVQTDNYNREGLFEALCLLETCIANENSEKRLHTIYSEMHKYMGLLKRKRFENETLFTFKETECISPENYIEPPPYDFNKHKHLDEYSYMTDPLFEYMIEELEKKKESKELDIQVDLEILKELL